MNRASSWVAIIVSVFFVLIVSVFAFTAWGGADTEMSTAGWIAMFLGIIVTMAVGVGLMALIFYSHRHGYDETDRGPGR